MTEQDNNDHLKHERRREIIAQYLAAEETGTLQH